MNNIAKFKITDNINLCIDTGKLDGDKTNYIAIGLEDASNGVWFQDLVQVKNHEINIEGSDEYHPTDTFDVRVFNNPKDDMPTDLFSIKIYENDIFKGE